MPRFLPQQARLFRLHFSEGHRDALIFWRMLQVEHVDCSVRSRPSRVACSGDSANGVVGLLREACLFSYFQTILV
jgi:hypothetical protein